jgi:zinc protease
MLTGNPDYFNEDLSRYKAIAAKDVRAVALSYLRDAGRVILSVVPQGKKELAATKSMD